MKLAGRRPREARENPGELSCHGFVGMGREQKTANNTGNSKKLGDRSSKHSARQTNDGDTDQEPVESVHDLLR